jgi:hypothetical protein
MFIVFMHDDVRCCKGGCEDEVTYISKGRTLVRAKTMITNHGVEVALCGNTVNPRGSGAGFRETLPLVSVLATAHII